MSERFDPSKHLSKVGPNDYLQVMWRLVWLRDVDKDATVETEIVSLADQKAIFKATVTLTTGGRATGYGSEEFKDFRDFIEKAETKAIGRALAALGFGTQFSAHEFGGEHENGRIVDSPVGPRNGSGATTPARARSTTVNTVPAADPDTGEIISWTVFWDRVEAMGLPRDGKEFITMTGIELGSNPALALEKAQAWHHDNPTQQGVPF